MAYTIKYTTDADADLRFEGRRTEATVRRAVPRYLADQPGVAAGKRKEMDPNPIGAPLVLRLGDLRVYYDLDEAAQIVRVLRVGR
jgi:hypothetical protein